MSLLYAERLFPFRVTKAPIRSLSPANSPCFQTSAERAEPADGGILGHDASVLAPFDRVEIDAFLYQLPEGAQLSQESDPLPHGLQDVVDLTLRGESPDAEADAAVRAFVGVAQGA